MTTVTRILHATSQDLSRLLAMCRTMGFIRADLWRRYGALGTVGKSASAVRKEITQGGWHTDLPLDGTVRAESTKDVINDILTYKAAAKHKVRRAVAARTTDETERKRLYTLLKQDKWLEDTYLHRMMRKHFRHGKSQCSNQFVVRSDKHSERIIDGQLVITLHLSKKVGGSITLYTTTSGKNVSLEKKNLRVIVREGKVEIHYAYEKPPGRPHGDKVMGVDKGYTEAFTDSQGQHHGESFGQVLTAYSHQVSATGKARNRLHALEKKHRAAGRIAKAERIRANNLGKKKQVARRQRTQQHLRTIAYQAAHTIMDEAALLASEDLTQPIAGKVQWRDYNRRMSHWAKGVLAQALDEVSQQRGTRHDIVNAAYTSQMDSITGRLEGERRGDKFYRANGDVIQADVNAARNVLARLDDPDITRYMPHGEVKRILLGRFSGATERQEARVVCQHGMSTGCG
jgi:transposase